MQAMQLPLREPLRLQRLSKSMSHSVTMMFPMMVNVSLSYRPKAGLIFLELISLLMQTMSLLRMSHGRDHRTQLNTGCRSM